VLYNLSHDPSLFYADYFGDRVLFFEHIPHILSIPQLLGPKTHATMPSFSPLIWGLTNVYVWAGLEP
jgi:hypothetical protein